MKLTFALLRLPALLLVAGLTACGGGGSSVLSGGQGPTAAKAVPVASTYPVIASVAELCTDCWPTFEHDANRSGYQISQTGITSATVAKLQLKWTFEAGESIVASPVVADGLIFVGTGAGNVIAIDQRTGTQVWRRAIGGPITQTPLVADGLVFAGTHKKDADLFALEEHTGVPRWHARLTGYARSAPILANGTLVIGQSGGDPPKCIQGGVLAFQATTGVLLWKWNTDPKANDGGAVWSPISYGGNDIIFGTGNTCSAGVPNANSLIRLTTLGKQEWQIAPQVAATTDDDWGGAVLLADGDFFAENKNGYFYRIDGPTGAIKFKVQVSPVDGANSFGSPATNGSSIVVPTGFLKVDANGYGITGALLGMGFSGQRLWSVPTLEAIPGGAAITNDVAFASLDFRLAALDVGSGHELWSYTPGNIFAYASPAVVSTGVYYANIGGQVMAFALGTSAAASAIAPSASKRFAERTLREPYGPIIRQLPNGTHRVVY